MSMADKIQTSILMLIIQRPLTMRLFTAVNDRNFTEASGGGYQPIEVDRSKWRLEDSQVEGQTVYFKFDGTAAIKALGAYLTDSDGTVLWAHSFEKPIEVRRDGDILPVRPTIRMMTVI